MRSLVQSTRRLASIVLLSGLSAAMPAAATGQPAPAVEHVRGIYLQRAIEVATVGSRTVRLTRMTRFERCGGLRGSAEDFNEHAVDVAGREVPGIGFVAGVVNALEGCARGDVQRDRRRPSAGARREKN
jgi:hypothetical protein